MSHDTDVIIIGGGLAGATAAFVLGRQGIRVTLIDQRPNCPPCFKAEKIEPHQAALFRKFELLDALLPFTGRVHTVLESKNGRVLKAVPVEQYGIYYHDMVNGIRAALPPSVDVRVGQVRDVQTGDDVQQVVLEDGATISGKLAIVSAGTSGMLQERLPLQRRTVRQEQSLAFGFSIARRDGRPFGFDALTYYPDGCQTRVGYLTLFLIGATMRANMFSFWSLREDVTRRFVHAPDAELRSMLPKLTSLIGEFELVSKVESGRIHLYTTENYLHPGVVFIGDTFQSVCPTTATGLSKILTDVDILCHELVPQWLKTPGMPAAKLTQFYDSPRKQAVDRHSLGGGLYARAMATESSLPWILRRARRDWKMRTGGWRNRLAGIQDSPATMTAKMAARQEITGQ